MLVNKSYKGGSVINLLHREGQTAVGRQATWSRGVPKPYWKICNASSVGKQAHIALRAAENYYGRLDHFLTYISVNQECPRSY